MVFTAISTSRPVRNALIQEGVKAAPKLGKVMLIEGQIEENQSKE